MSFQVTIAEMEAVEVSVAEGLRADAIKVTRNLPAAHWLTKLWRRFRFRQLAESFTDHVYETDVKDFTLQDFDTMEAAINIATHAIEIHLLEHEPLDHDALRHYYSLIERLRTAREGISRGYAADPARRPTRERVRQEGMRTLHEVLKAEASKDSRAAS